MARILMALGVIAVAGLVLSADEPKQKGPSADELLSKGMEQARKDGKRVFLIFGAPGCGWCKLFDKYHADAEVMKVLGKHIVLVKVDLAENAGGETLYKKYGSDRGVPAWTILDVESKVLADSGDGKDNVGFPAEPDEITRYFAALRKSCPNLADSEVTVLTQKLKEVNPKK